MNKKRPWPLYILLALLLFQGIGALAGGAALIIKPDGSLLHMPLSLLQGSLFMNYLIPGLTLMLILGVYPVFTFAILLAQPDWKFLQKLNIYSNRYAGWTFSLFVGLGLIIWMDVEVAVIGFGSIVQAVYAGLGLLVVIFTLTPSVMRYFERPE